MNPDNNKFDLDDAIMEWRQQMSAGIKSPETLDELESHLREDVGQQTRLGLSAQIAFGAAVQRIGQAAALECEFEKIGGIMKAKERAKHALLTLAGIPNHYLDTPMNTSSSNLNVQPAWATYFKGAAFLIPVLILWCLSAVFVVPQVQATLMQSGIAASDSVWQFTRFNNAVMRLIMDHALVISVVIVVMLTLLEWRSRSWPRYRRAAVGTVAFLLNLVVLLSIFMIIISAAVGGAVLAHHAG